VSNSSSEQNLKLHQHTPNVIQQKEQGKLTDAKAARKMLVKLTPGEG